MSNPPTLFCACGCGQPLSIPRFPSRQRRYIVGHSVRNRIYTQIPLDVRFWEKVNKCSDSECWEWIAYRDKDGYGHIRVGGRGTPTVGAHRIAYQLTYGPIPDNLLVCHKCDNPSCVNPSHLFLGADQDNVNDMIAKGRKVAPRGERQSRAKLTADGIKYIRQEYKLGNAYMYELAEKFNVSIGHICNIINLKSWKHID